VRVVKLFTRPGPLLALVVVVVVIAWGLRFGGLVGAVLGLLLELVAFQVGTLLGALVWRLRVRHVIFGIGRELRAWTSPKLRIVVCAIPVVLLVGVRSIHPPVRRRLWLAGLTSVLGGVAAAAVAWLSAGGDVSRGLAVGATACLLHQLQPRREAEVTSPGWHLFMLPRVTGRTAAEMDATPLVNDVVDAVREGDLESADVALAKLVAEHPTLLMTAGAQATVLSARARYAEALHVVSTLVGRTDLEPRDMAFVMAEMANATASAVEANQLPADIGVPAATRSADAAIQFGFPRTRLAGTFAQLALVNGDHAKALELARQSADGSEGGLARADALATLARAHMAAGDNATARAVLAEAEELASWLPRVEETAARLRIS
jgi:hypothetical protein